MSDDKDPVAVGLLVPQDILTRIDTYRQSHPLHPSRSALIRQILHDWAASQSPKPRVRLTKEN